jgi:LemA protein
MNSNRPKIWLISGFVVVVLLFYVGIAYNGLVRTQEDVKKNWSDLQATYQRRSDLIPSLVSVVKGSSDYEKQTLEDVMNARAKAQQLTISTSAGDFSGYQHVEAAQAQVVQSVNRIIALAEKYPDLKSTKSYLYLQTQLEGTERRVKVSRNDFNSSVADYNKKVRQFPSSLVAKMFGFSPKEGFSNDVNAENPPEVKF